MGRDRVGQPFAHFRLGELGGGTRNAAPGGVLSASTTLGPFRATFVANAILATKTPRMGEVGGRMFDAGCSMLGADLTPDSCSLRPAHKKTRTVGGSCTLAEPPTARISSRCLWALPKKSCQAARSTSSWTLMPQAVVLASFWAKPMPLGTLVYYPIGRPKARGELRNGGDLLRGVGPLAVNSRGP